MTEPFDLPAGAVQFELLTEATARRAAPAVPRGAVGKLSTEGGDAAIVSFDAGCVLRIASEGVGRRPEADPGRVFRATIVACDIAEPFILLIRVSLANRGRPYFMIPATLYGTNNADRGVVAGHGTGLGGDPKLTWRAPDIDRLAVMSHSWHFRADHSSVPSASATFEGRFVGLGIEETSQAPDGRWTYNGLGIWTSAEHGDALSVSIGSLDWPGRLCCHVLHPGCVVEPLTSATAVGLSCRFCLCGRAAADGFAYEPFIAGWYDAIHEPPRAGAPLRRAMSDVVTAVTTHGIDPASGHFHMFRTPEGIAPSTTLLAWAGILQIARPLIRTARLLDDAAVHEQAVNMVQRAVADAVDPGSGLFFDGFRRQRWGPNDWWTGLGLPSVVNGHACHLLMKMCDDDPGRTAWARAAESVLRRVLPHQRADGRFPAGFQPDTGAPTDFTGYGGCFFVEPLLALCRRSADPQARDAALRAMGHYWAQFTCLEWVGVDLDCAGAVDSGSSYALARALAEWHAQTGDADTLEHLGHVLHYAFTYRFGHNTRHRGPAPCDWSSSGSKVTSTHNVHLDAYGGEILETLQYYLRQRDDAYLRSRLVDSMAWARQAYNRTEGEYGWGPVGCSTEQYYHTYDRYHSTDGDGSVWTGYFPWTSGSLLNAFIAEALEAES